MQGDQPEAQTQGANGTIRKVVLAVVILIAAGIVGWDGFFWWRWFWVSKDRSGQVLGTCSFVKGFETSFKPAFPYPKNSYSFKFGRSWTEVPCDVHLQVKRGGNTLKTSDETWLVTDYMDSLARFTLGSLCKSTVLPAMSKKPFDCCFKLSDGSVESGAGTSYGGVFAMLDSKGPVPMKSCGELPYLPKLFLMYAVGLTLAISTPIVIIVVCRLRGAIKGKEASSASVYHLLA
jgi:hypothetical protein